MTPPPAAVATQAERRAATRSALPRPAARPERRSPLTVVEPAPRHTRARRRRLAPALSLALVVGSLMATVVGHAVLDEGQVRLAAAQGSLAAAQSADHQATLQAARLEAPARIVGEATGQLHMAQPSETVQLPHVPLDKPLPMPTVSPAPPAATPASTTSGSATSASTAPVATPASATSASTAPVATPASATSASTAPSTTPASTTSGSATSASTAPSTTSGSTTSGSTTSGSTTSGSATPATASGQ